MGNSGYEARGANSTCEIRSDPLPNNWINPAGKAVNWVYRGQTSFDGGNKKVALKDQKNRREELSK